MGVLSDCCLQSALHYSYYDLGEQKEFQSRIAAFLETDHCCGCCPHLQFTRKMSCCRPSGLVDSTSVGTNPQAWQGKIGKTVGYEDSFTGYSFLRLGCVFFAALDLRSQPRWPIIANIGFPKKKNMRKLSFFAESFPPEVFADDFVSENRNLFPCTRQTSPLYERGFYFGEGGKK
jgi:hypothetical protein